MKPEDLNSVEFWRSLGIEAIVIEKETDWDYVKDAVVDAAAEIKVQHADDTNPNQKKENYE